jgi:hypothetical protein
VPLGRRLGKPVEEQHELAVGRTVDERVEDPVADADLGVLHGAKRSGGAFVKISRRR